MTTARIRPIAPPLVALLLLSLLLALVPARAALAADARTEARIEAQFVSLLNRERVDRGLAPVQVSAELTKVARAHTAKMVTTRRLHHNPDLARSVTNWRKLGENVGRGARATSVHEAFMRSAAHRRNVLDRDWRQVGVGVDVRDGVIWITQVYRVPQR